MRLLHLQDPSTLFIQSISSSARQIPELREVRAGFLGRAIHSSHEAWQKQVEAILTKAGL